ncbi:MAG TPA: glycoside hydrolase family 95 protein, partial [Chthoniobacteraceae bacterium]|nr:glycoside hydrolase family 95 protein [Chthoniobacteraceae bacterium]
QITGGGDAPILISFRPDRVIPDGFMVDAGKDFGPHGPLAYGWKPGTYRRIASKKYNDSPILANQCIFMKDAAWQIALPNGLYDVAVCVGSPDDMMETLPLRVQDVPYFPGLEVDRNIFLKQWHTVSVKDGMLIVSLDPKRVTEKWRDTHRFVAVPFIEIRHATQSEPEKTLCWSVDSDPATDAEFYDPPADIRSTSKPPADLLNTLWYTRPAKIWEEGAVLGNGRLGAVVYGDPVRERLQLNEDTLWNLAPNLPFANPDAKKYLAQARQLIFEGKNDEAWDFIFKNIFHRADGKYGPFMADYLNGGDVILDFPKRPVENYYRSLDMRDGIATTAYTEEGVAYRREMFASVGAGVLVLRLTADHPGRISFHAMARDDYGGTVSAEGQDTLLVSGTEPSKNGIPAALHYQKRIKVIAEGGTVSASNGGLIVANANAVTMLIAIRTNFVTYKDVGGDPVARTRDEIASAANRSYDDLRKAQLADQHQYYDRLSLNLGQATTLDLPTDERIRRFDQTNDPQMVALLFNFGRYLMLGCSRPGCQAANLQGIWNQWYSGAWGGKYTVNINTEMNYWLPEPANLSECHEPLFDLINGLADRGRDTAQAYYGARGWVCHHNTDIWRDSHPIDGKAGMWPMASAWLCDDIWERYQYTLDTDFLRRMYPALRDCAVFYLDFLVKDPRSGYLVTVPSMSPETGRICAAPTVDVQLLQDLFSHAVAAAKILEVDGDLQRQWEADRAQLPPMKIGNWGQLQEWTDADLDSKEDHNRHASHLYGLYPSNQINPWKTPRLFAAAKVSLLARGDEATGWSLAWKVNFWARLRDGEHAYRLLTDLIRPSYRPATHMWGSGIYPNFFDAHPPFQIDGNFGSAAGVLEMLLQSQNGELDILPALPPEWPEGSISGMKARGALTVSMSWKAGKLVSATFLPAQDEIIHVRLGDLTKEFPVKKGAPLTVNSNLDSQ